MRHAIHQRNRRNKEQISTFHFSPKTRVRLQTSPWILLAALMTISPLASFQQVDPDKRIPRVTFALHRTKASSHTQLRQVHLHEIFARRTNSTNPKVITLPTRDHIAQADRDMIEQFLFDKAFEEEIVLPAVGLLQYIAADEEMDLLFHLSNASWIVNLTESDTEMNKAFWQENMPFDSMNPKG